ncbi:UbiA prenyltransferase domain-containing protein 1 [Durusdinium trenchii]|uniref:UbiA prenyltransferase domain-containing protein 1 n=1 Tax=Durusdinium trenchii TaxID=1381693 RepID=A0ABP0H8Z7_9DINO
MRQRPTAKRRSDSPAEVKEPPATPATPAVCALEPASLLRNRAAKDFLARLAFVGIFIVENVLHAIHFEFEVDNMVIPAVKPLPYEFAVSLHLVHIIFGLFGALFVLVSGFDTAGRTALTKGTSMMLVFMGTITWTWWINRQGVLYWDLDVWRNVESAVEWDFFSPNLAWGCLVSWV